jgi:hypothetical protein
MTEDDRPGSGELTWRLVSKSESCRILEFPKRILGKRMTGYRMTDPFGLVRSRSRQLAVMVSVTVMPVLGMTKQSEDIRFPNCSLGLGWTPRDSGDAGQA